MIPEARIAKCCVAFGTPTNWSNCVCFFTCGAKTVNITSWTLSGLLVVKLTTGNRKLGQCGKSL